MPGSAPEGSVSCTAMRALFAVLVGFASCTGSPSGEQWESFFFIQMADTQLAFGDYQENVRKYEAAIAHANRLKPDFVVICGDLISDPFKEAECEEFQRITRLLDSRIPLYLVSGNHDVGNEPTPESLAWYRNHFGADWYSFEHKGCLGIVLDSSIIKSPDSAPGEFDKQWAWLVAELDRARRSGLRHIFVFQHHPWFLTAFDETDQYFNLSAADRARFFDLFEKYDVRAVFAGHYHRNSHGTHSGIEMVTTSAVGRQLGADQSGFRVVQVFRDRIEHHYYDLQSVPTKIQTVMSHH